MDSAKPIYKYLKKQNNQVVDLITHGQTLHKLSKTLKPLINQHIGSGWQLGKCSDKEITLLVNSAELANRLRFQVAKVLQEAKKLKSCDGLNKINIKIGPLMKNEAQEKPPNKKAAPIPSQKGRQYLKSLAETIEDPGLKKSLQRLAKRVFP